MPRGRLVTPKDDLDAFRLLTEHHIVQFRRGTSGRITEVDHVEFGWMKPEMYYRLQKLHDAIPLITKFMEGGYRLKAQLWQSSVEVQVLGTGTKFPIGMALFGAAVGLHAIDTLAGKPMEAALDIAALFLPFGELWYLFRGAVDIGALGDAVIGAVDAAREGVTGTVEDAQEALQDILSGQVPQVPGGPLPPM